MTDWAAIEVEYRKGAMSVRALAAEHGLSDTAIRKKANNLGWERDLAEKIHQKAEALVRAKEVRTQVRANKRITEKREIEVAATIQAEKIMAHRAELTQWRDIEMQLMTELVATSGNIELMSQIGELMAKPDEAGIDKLNDLYRKVITLPGRVDTLKKLAEVREKRINLERRVFNIQDGEAPENPADKITRIVLVAVRPERGVIIEGDANECT